MDKFVLGKEIIDLSTPKVMGILNVTPDSFFDGGQYVSEVSIIERVHSMARDGVDIIDIGAYSTRPGAIGVEEKEEIGRLTFAVELVRKYYPYMPISIDTFRASVAKEIYGCMGDVIINDISGGTMDEKMFDFVVESGLPYVMMHIQGTPTTMQNNPQYADVVQEVKQFLKERVDYLNKYGYNNIILDPGFGFGKLLEHNYTLLKGMDELCDLQLPILVGVSRKSMIYRLLGCDAAMSLNGTTIINTLALTKGAKILRVHDVKEAVEAVHLYNAYCS